jgi:hypothetical protein
MSLATRVLAASASGALLASVASAQYSTGFEGVAGSPAGTVLTGQDGYYLPAGTVNVDFLAFTYAGNALGVTPNPTGGSQFVSVTGPGAGTFGRAQRDFAYSPGKSTIAFDIHASYIGVLPASQNLGSVSMQPFPGSQSFISLATWTDINTATTWAMNYVYFDAAGVQVQEAILDPAFQNLSVSTWYRWETDIDLVTNAITCARITNLATGTMAVYPIVGRYMLGGTAGSTAPTGYRIFSGGGAAGNTLAFDNVAIGPKYPAPELIHYKFDSGDATNSATGLVGNGVVAAGVGFASSTPLSAGTAAPYAVCTTVGATCQIDTGWIPNLAGGDWSIGSFINIQPAGTVLQYPFGALSAASFRCFTQGVAGANNWLLRATGMPDALITGGAVPGVTNHVVWCHDSTADQIRCYLNGALVNTVNSATSTFNFTGTTPLTVMRYNGNTSSLTAGGIMDDFRLYSRCISAAEIAHWYAHGDHAIGTSYCDPAVVNSTGSSGVLAASGSTIVDLNGFRLSASSLPLNSFGYYLTSLTRDFVPMAGGSTGTLCLGGNVGRAVGGVIVNSGATGTTSVVGDLTMQPQPLGNVAVVPCQTWHYQYWYRDIGTSNLTNGVSVMFQ